MAEVFALDQAYDGRVGDARDRISAMASEALVTLRDARAWRRSEALREQEVRRGDP